MQTIQPFQPLTATFFAGKESLAKDIYKTSTCTRIKNFVRNIFAKIIYYLTCCKIDWRIKTVSKEPAIITFMKERHNGIHSKRQVKDSYSWYTEIKGRPVIIFQPMKAFADEGSTKSQFCYYFNKDGEIDKITIDGKDIEQQLDPSTKVKLNRNYFLSRSILEQLMDGCGIQSCAPIKPALADPDTKQKKAISEISKHLKPGMRTTLYDLKGVFYPPMPRFLVSSPSSPAHSQLCIQVKYTRGTKGSLLSFEGQDMRGEKLCVEIFFDPKKNQVLRRMVDKKEVRDLKERGYFESLVWVEELAKLLKQR